MIHKIVSQPSYLSSWNHRIRLSYWMLGILVFISVLLTWPFLIRENAELLPSFIRNQLIFQNSLILCTLLIAELVYRIKSKIHDYAIITIGSVFGSITISLASTEVHGVQVVMILPILVSILYLSYGKVLFACLVTLMPYLIIMGWIKGPSKGIPLSQITLGFWMIILCTAAGLAIVNRGLKIIKEEMESLVNEEKHLIGQRAIDEASRKDALTGLNNHRTFQERFREMMEVKHTEPLHLALIDIDDFKLVNDTFGHSVGDTVLRRMAGLLREINEEHIFTARYGGEEFAVIFTEMSSLEVADWLEKLRMSAEELSFTELDGRRVTVSIGCHCLEEDENRDDLFQITDEALYKAKRNGKNRIEWGTRY